MDISLWSLTIHESTSISYNIIASLIVLPFFNDKEHLIKCRLKMIAITMYCIILLAITLP